MAFTGAVLIAGAGAGVCAGLGEDFAFVLFLPALVDGLAVGSFVGAIDGRAVVGSLVGAMDGLTVVGSLVGEIDGFCCIIIADILV